MNPTTIRPHPPTGRSGPVVPGRLRLLRLGVACASALALAATSTPAGASLTGYGPVGPDPATRMGLSVPVLAAEVGAPSGSVLEAEVPGMRVVVTRPRGYSSEAQIVSVTDLSGDGVAEALLPAGTVDGSEVVLAVGVGVRAVETTDASGTTVTTPSVRGRAVRGPVPADATQVTAGPPGPADVLTVQLESPSLVGATVVVVGGDEVESTASTGDTVTVGLPGPAAVFALRPADPTAGPSGPPSTAEDGTLVADEPAEAVATAGGDDAVDDGAGTATTVVLVTLLAAAITAAAWRLRNGRGARTTR